MKLPRFPHLLSAAFLLAGITPSNFAVADVTLVYGEVAKSAKTPEKDKVLSAQRIYLREGALALETFGTSRVVVFDQEASTVQIVDHEKKIYFDLDAAMVARMAERLSETQRKVLEGFEDKAAKWPKDERKRLREILDDLHAATELQLGEVPETRYEDSAEPETVGKFEAKVVNAFRNERPWARYFLVAHEKLGMTAGEYQTLVEFQTIIRRFSEQTPGALRKNFGDLEMLAKAGQVPVLVELFHVRPQDPPTQRLLNHFEREIEPEWFEVPKDYQAVTLRPDPVQLEKGA